MLIKKQVSTIFHIQPGEGQTVSLLLLYYFLLGGAFNFVQTAAFSLFLVEFNAQTLAYVYIANALVVPLITTVYLRLGRRISFPMLLAVNLGFLLVLVIAFRIGLGISGTSWFVFALPILFQILVNLGNLSFWPLNGADNMLSTVEKVIILKGASIFAETPDAILAEVAQALEEMEVESGETIFEKGDPGDSMYVLASGKVRVHDGAHTLNTLASGDVFGEMALLDPEARVASVTAQEYSRLLRLDQDSFYDLMTDRIEVARGIIQVLSRRLRERVHDLNELHANQEITPQPG